MTSSTPTGQLHTGEAALSARHLPSWWALAAAAGAVNSTAFMASERFVSHMSGTATRIGIGGASEVFGDALAVLVCFVCGAMTSVFFIDARVFLRKPPLHWLCLLIVVTLLVGVALAGHAGVFGAFDGTADLPWRFVVPLGFAMGLLNATCATATGSIVRITHVTGPSTDLGIHLGRALYTYGSARRRELEAVLLRAGSIIAFALGAAGAVPIAGYLEYLTLLVPAAVIVVATLRSLMPVRVPRAVREEPALVPD